MAGSEPSEKARSFGRRQALHEEALGVRVFPLLIVAISQISTFSAQGINQTADGLAVSPRDHTNTREMSKLGDQELRLAIAEGGDAVQKSELMPAWGKTLSAEAIDDLVRYLRRLCTCAGRK
jgi:cytochrome c oxidase cbb3-type subunit 3